jgi:hypothetical protein
LNFVDFTAHELVQRARERGELADRFGRFLVEGELATHGVDLAPEVRHVAGAVQAGVDVVEQERGVLVAGPARLVE